MTTDFALHLAVREAYKEFDFDPAKCIAFDDDIPSGYIAWQMYIPNWNGGPVAIAIRWAAEAYQDLRVVWDLCYETVQDHESPTAPQCIEVVSKVIRSSWPQDHKVEGVVLGKGDFHRLSIRRMPLSEKDTCPGKAYLYGLQVFYSQ